MRRTTLFVALSLVLSQSVTPLVAAQGRRAIVRRALIQANKSLHLERGRRLYKAKSWAAAASEFEKAVEMEPTNAEARYELARVLNKLEKFEEAEKSAREAIRLKPDYAEAHALLGHLLSALKRSEESIAEYREAIRLNPREAKFHSNLGNVYGALARRDEAIAELQTALRLKPRDEYTLTLLGIEYQNLERYEESLDYLSRALRFAPKYPYALQTRSQTYLYLNRWDESVRDAERHLAVQGWKDPQALYSALFGALGYRLAGRESASRRLLEEAQQNTTEGTWPRPVVLYLLGRLPEAKLFEMADDNDKQTEVRAYVGTDLLLRGRTQEALPHLRWVDEHGNKAFIEYRLARTALRLAERRQ